MGTVQDGTLCAYCGVNEAYYIPDGYAGPFCLGPEGASCWDIQERHGWEVVVRLRVRRFSRYKFLGLAKKPHPVLELQGIIDIITHFIIFV